MGNVQKEEIEEVFRGFLGESKQVPPMYSAVKFKGKKLYELARKGIVVEREPRDIRIDELRLLDFDSPRCTFLLRCSRDLCSPACRRRCSEIKKR